MFAAVLPGAQHEHGLRPSRDPRLSTLDRDRLPADSSLDVARGPAAEPHLARHDGPFVCGFLSLTAVLGVLTALFWEFFSKTHHFPFWTVLGISVGIAMLQIPYYLLIRLFSKN